VLGAAASPRHLQPHGTPQARNLLPRELAPLTRPQSAGTKPCVARAAQPQDGMTDSLEHASYLPIAPLVQRELDPRRAEPTNAGRGGSSVLELEPGRERGESLVARLTPDVRHVDLLDAVPRMREPMRERAVVGEDEHSSRIAVEAPHGDDADLPAHEVDHRRSTARVARRRDRPPRLHEQYVAQSALPDLPAVDPHDIGALDERVELPRGIVHGHLPRLDQLVGLATRGDTSTGEEGIEAHRSIVPAPSVGGGYPPPVPDHADLTRRLADLVVGYGANVQPGQIVGVTTYTGKEELTREIARAAYEHGARWVDVSIHDPLVKRQRLLHAEESTLDYIPPWMIDRLEWLSNERAARISLTGPAIPDALDGIDPGRAGRDLLPYLPTTGEVVNRGTTNWCVAPAPSSGWAALVFPELEPEAALDRLWELIAHVCRLDEEDPAGAWRERAHTLESVAARLTDRRFDAIRLRGPGTDVTVGLFPSSTWNAADFTTVDGLRHFPNIPSEEIFTTPDPTRVDGHVTATRPLELYGAVMDGIRVEFEGGIATRMDAERGADTLRSLTAKDEGASRLGELALVDGEGRIGPLGTVFYETLLDENAASHVALGSAYDIGVEDESDRGRINTSEVHVDFMIGSPEVDVDGVTRDGDAVPLLRGGAWQI